MDLVIVFISFFIDARFSFLGLNLIFRRYLLMVSRFFLHFVMTGKAIFETFSARHGLCIVLHDMWGLS